MYLKNVIHFAQVKFCIQCVTFSRYIITAHWMWKSVGCRGALLHKTCTLARGVCENVQRFGRLLGIKLHKLQTASSIRRPWKGPSYFWEFCSRLAAFWEAGFCLAWFSQPRASYSTQSVSWLWASRKWCGRSLFSSNVWPAIIETSINKVFAHAEILT